MKTRDRDAMKEMMKAEALLDRVATLLPSLDREGVSAETMELYAAQITAMSAAANAYASLATAYCVAEL